MKNTVTISIEEFDQLRYGFKQSKLKDKLERELKKQDIQIKRLQEDLDKVLKEDFIEKKTYHYTLFSGSTVFYFRKDKTPNWIKRLFNKI